MNKTGSEIEQDFYALVKNSPIAGVIKGRVYIDGSRPINAKTEDAVIAFITGLDAQIQTGAVHLNIYVPDFDNGSGVFVKDGKRCRELERIADQAIRALKPSDYLIYLLNTIKTTKVQETDTTAEGISQHCINVKIGFDLKTF